MGKNIVTTDDRPVCKKPRPISDNNSDYSGPEEKVSFICSSTILLHGHVWCHRDVSRLFFDLSHLFGSSHLLLITPCFNSKCQKVKAKKSIFKRLFGSKNGICTLLRYGHLIFWSFILCHTTQVHTLSIWKK